MRPERTGRLGYRIAKRALDLAIAGPGILLLSPILLSVSAAILVTMGRPVFFRQRRPGKFEQPFTLVKFRTMRPASDAASALATDEQRLTPLGRLLRRWSLDELPELWNVVAGDLSLVGPRPLLMEYLDRYSSQERRRHEVPPGITGWTQVNGRNALTWREKFELDLWYVEHASFWLDLRILGKTAIDVARGRGVSARDHATMPEYRGHGTAP
jgi:sugar transferase EpsL